MFSPVIVVSRSEVEARDSSSVLETLRALMASPDTARQYSALGLQCLAHCFLPPFLTAEARQRIHREQLVELLSKRWFPAMNQVCEWVGFSEVQIETLTNRSVDYLFNGPVAA